MKRLPSLDGLRGISVALVLLGHLAGTRGFVSVEALRPYGDLGNLGVRVFFVISGFLITHLLMGEIAKTGDISLVGFDRRRVLRILPAFGVYATAIVGLSAAGVIASSDGDIPHLVSF